MDVLEQFLSGGKTAAEPSKKQPLETNRIPADVQAQRDRDALAIHQAELKKEQVGLAQTTDPMQKLRHQSSIEGLLREISRNPASKAQTSAPAAPVVAAPVAQAAPSGDPLEAFLSGKITTAPVAAKAAPVTPQAAPAATIEQPPTDGARQAIAQTAAQVTEPGGVRQLVGKFLKGALETKRDMPERVAGAIDTLYGVVPATYGAFVQGLARTAQSPERAEQTGQAAAASIDKPVGKFFGLTGKETYQKPLGGITEPVIEQVKKMAEQLGMTPKQISEKTGIPEQDIKNMVVIGSVAVPQAIKEVAPVVKETVQAVTTPIKQAAAELQIVKPGQLTKEQAQAQFEAMQAPVGSAGAAAVQNNPYLGKITGEETARGAGVGATFPQIKLTKIPKDVPVVEQQLRSQLFQDVLPALKPRPGVVTGNDNLLRNEHGLANMAEPSPLGLKLKEQIANEQVGLSKFAEERVNATGASRSFTNDEQRGNFVNDVAYGKSPDDLASSSLTGYLNQVKQETYNSAFKNAGNNKINTTNVDDLFVNPQEIATFKAAGTSQLLEAAKDLINEAKTAGFKLPNGEIAAPGSVAAYDRVRKIFNSPRVWTPEKAESIRTINQAIDKDIAAVADPAMYKLGDKIHQVEKTILGSTGFKRLFGEVDANGNVTSKVAPEKMLSSLNNLRKDEWRHIRDTFNELANGRVRGAPEGLPPVPPELRQAAAGAVAEMDGALAREVYKAGADKVGEWNSNSVNKTMTSVVGEKILETFPPNEVKNYVKLNLVGQFTPGLKYEGAGQQARRISLLEKNYPAVGATVGSSLGAVIGETPLSKEAALGAFIGREAGSYLQAKKAAREEAKAVKKMEKEMEKASALGKQTGKNKLEDLNK
jgi:hypothetical protein